MNDNKQPRRVYKVKNWPEYTAGLKRRGSLFAYITEEVADLWYAAAPEERRQGRTATYSDFAIQLCLEIKSHMGLAYRQTEGFINSLMVLAGVPVKCPAYTILCRRAASLEVDLAPHCSSDTVTLAIDATGLKVRGEGEWKVRQHGKEKRRDWRKLHPLMDIPSRQVLALATTDQYTSDDQLLPPLLAQVSQEIEAVYGDGAFDKTPCYEAVYRCNAKPIFPPRIDAVLQAPGNIITHEYNPALQPRDQAILAIDRYKQQGLCPKQARKQWLQDIGYHLRSLIETHMFRHKITFGPTLFSKNIPQQITEANIKTRLLNRFALYAIPDSYPVFA